MVDIERLNQAVNDSGLKRYAIAEMIGINKRTLENKLKGKTHFTAPEIQALAVALRMTKAERDNIFFAN